MMGPGSAPSRKLLLLLLGLTSFILATSASPQPPLSRIRRQDPNSNSNSTSTSSSSTNSTSKKAGLAWPNGNSVDILPFTRTGKVSWYYTWSAWPITLRRSGWSWSSQSNPVPIEFVPMFWGSKVEQEFRGSMNSAWRLGASGSGVNVSSLLGMNEPEHSTQSNLTPGQGVDLWLSTLEPLKGTSPQLRLGSPAVSSAPQGRTWLQDFFRICAGRCSVDSVALHWYGTSPSAFIAHLEDYRTTFNLPLWVTEWGCHDFVNAANNARECSAAKVKQFMKETQDFMDKTDWVERYAWFGAMKDLPDGVGDMNVLLDSEGKINALGRQYIGATPDEPLESSAMTLTIPTLWTFVFVLAIKWVY